MSRIGKQPVALPKGVTVTVGQHNQLIVKGPKGELKQDIDRDITVEVKDDHVYFSRPTDQIRHRALHGLYRSLVFNMVKGVTEGYKRQLELIGVGFKASNQGNILADLGVGLLARNIIFEVPKELEAGYFPGERGESEDHAGRGLDKQLLGQVAAKIRSLRKPEPYKGKGVRYVGEVVRKKAGKAAGK